VIRAGAGLGTRISDVHVRRILGRRPVLERKQIQPEHSHCISAS
jgi:hypothetical protein